MRLKFIPLVIASASLLFAVPSSLHAGDGKDKPRDINQFLEKHPKLKEKILAKFDTNHNGVLDGDEIAAFRKWFKERREKKLEKREENGGKGGKGGKDGKGDHDAAVTATPTPAPAQ